MKISNSALIVLSVILSFGTVTGCNAQNQTTTQQKLTSLKDLHDSGVLSDAEYQQKVAALNGHSRAATGISPSGAPAGSGTVAHTLVDQTWQIPAATVKAPRGWGFAGGVVHAAGGACTVTGTSAVMNIESPDGSEGLVAMPALRAQYVSDPATMQQYTQHGCLVATGMTATDFLKNIIIPKARPGARILDSGPDPLLEPTVAQNTQQARSMGGAPMVFSSARVRISYTRNGHPVEEFVSGLVGCVRQQVQGTSGFSVDCTADSLSLLHAPAGQLDALAARKDMVSLTPSPAWQQQMAQSNRQFQQASQQQMQQQQNQNAQNSNTYLQNNLDAIHRSAQQGQQNVDMIHNIGNTAMNVDRQRQGAIDHAAQGTALSMSNSNIYTDPNTGKQVQLSDQYNHTYVSADGTTVQQTNSASGPIGGGWWTEMTPSY